MPRLEVADIFRAHGPTWRDAERGHFSLGQLKVMSADRAVSQRRARRPCAALLRVRAAADRLQLLPQPALSEVPEQCRAALARSATRPTSYPWSTTTWSSPCRRPSVRIAYTNKELIYGLLFDFAAETLRTIAADPKHLGARIGTTLVLHTWGSALTHHPHVHGIVPGGGARARCRSVGAVQAGVLPLGAGALAAVPAPLPRRARERPSRRSAQVLRRARGSGRRRRLCRLAHAAASVRVGRLRQAPVLGTRAGSRLSVALHPSGRDLQLTPRGTGRSRRHLPLERLPRHRAALATKP